MYGNNVKDNYFNSFVNKLFCMKYIEKYMKFNQKIDVDSIMINIKKCYVESKIINIKLISYQMKWIQWCNILNKFDGFYNNKNVIKIIILNEMNHST